MELELSPESDITIANAKQSKAKQTHLSGSRRAIPFSVTIAYLSGMKYASYATPGTDAG